MQFTLGIGAMIGVIAVKQLYEMVKIAVDAINTVGVVQDVLLALTVAGTFIYTLHIKPDRYIETHHLFFVYW